MKKTITGLIFGNNKMQCKREMFAQLLKFTHKVEVLKFRKLKDKDLYSYKCKIEI